MATKMRKLYAYTKQAYIDLAKLGGRVYGLKVGQTDLETAQERVNQQDGTSDAEPLLIQKVYHVPSYITDEMIHKELERMGFRPTRTDKNREWYPCTVEDVSKAINNI